MTNQLVQGSTEDIYKEVINCQHTFRDIYIKWNVDGKIRSGFDLKIQSTIDSDMPIRLFAYDEAKYRERHMCALFEMIEQQHAKQIRILEQEHIKTMSQKYLLLEKQYNKLLKGIKDTH